MAKNNKKTYWPHMILGFLGVGITLGYWTIKSANALPVQESNTYMLKYQQTDMTINEITHKKIAFDKLYTIEIQDVVTMVMTDNVNSNRPQPNPVKLSLGNNHFTYTVMTKDGKYVNDAEVSFLLTRPHSRRDDVMLEKVNSTENKYTTEVLDIQKPGRYTLQLKVAIDDTIGYSSIAAYLTP